MRLAFVAIAVCLSLGIPGAVAAKGAAKKASKKEEKKKVAKLPGSAADMYKQISGPVKPLPKPTDLSLHFEIDAADAEAYTVEAAPAAAVTQSTARLAWTVADWRRQIDVDVKWLAHYRRLLGGQVRKSQRERFVVAERYLIGLFDAADQFLRLAKQDRDQFNVEFPADRDGEIMTAPPDISHRVRLYRDRAQTLYGNAEKFLARTVQDREAKIVRVEAK